MDRCLGIFDVIVKVLVEYALKILLKRMIGELAVVSKEGRVFFFEEYVNFKGK